MNLMTILRFISFFFLSLIFPILLILFVTKKIPKNYLKKVQILTYPILFFIRDFALNFLFFTLGVGLMILTFFTEKIALLIRCRKDNIGKTIISDNRSNYNNKTIVINSYDNENENENINYDNIKNGKAGGKDGEGNYRDKIYIEKNKKTKNYSENDAFDLETVVEEDLFEGQTMDEVS